MNAFKSKQLMSGFVLSALILVGCGGAAPAPTAKPAATAVPAKQTVVIELGSKGDEIAFDKTALSAPAGSRITIKFKNNANPNSGMLHNVVVVKPGTQDGVAAEGIAAGEALNYVKKDDARVLAMTKVIKGGESVEVSFDAPAPGDYPVICTFPGHYVLMKAVLTVK